MLLIQPHLRLKKVIDMLDEKGFKPLSALKKDQGFAKLNWFSLFRLKTPLEKFCSRNHLTLTSTGVTHSHLYRKVKHILTMSPASVSHFKGSARAPATREELCYFTNQKAQSQGQEQRFGRGRIKAWMVTANNAAK